MCRGPGRKWIVYIFWENMRKVFLVLDEVGGMPKVWETSTVESIADLSDDCDPCIRTLYDD